MLWRKWSILQWISRSSVKETCPPTASVALDRIMALMNIAALHPVTGSWERFAKFMEEYEQGKCDNGQAGLCSTSRCYKSGGQAHMARKCCNKVGSIISSKNGSAGRQSTWRNRGNMLCVCRFGRLLQVWQQAQYPQVVLSQRYNSLAGRPFKLYQWMCLLEINRYDPWKPRSQCQLQSVSNRRSLIGFSISMP